MKIFYYFLMLVSIVFSIVSVFAFCDLGYDVLQLKVNFGHFEDTSIQEIFRIVEGKKIFETPSVEYVPLLYGPVYFYISVPFSLFFGKSFLSGRIVSVASVFLLCILTYFLLKNFLRVRFQKLIFLTFISLGLFFSANELFDFWLYTAKVDSLFLLLLVLTFLFLLESEKKIFFLYLSAFFASLLFFTKQNGVILSILIPIFLFLLNQKNKAVIFSFLFTFFSVLFFAFFYIHSGEKLITFMITIPKSHPMLWKVYAPDLIKYFFPIFGALCIFLISLFWNRLQKKGFIDFQIYFFQKLVKSKKNSYLVLLIFSFFLISFLGKMKAGAVGNSWIYFVYSASVFFAVLIGRYSEIYLHKEKNRKYFLQVAFVYVLFFVQGGIFSYDYSSQKKSIAQLKENEQATIDHLCGLQTPVLFPFAGYLPEILCGNRGSGFQQQSVLDIVKDKKEFDHFISRYKSAIESGYYKTIILTTSLPLEHTDGGIKFLNFQIANARTEKEKENFLAFRSLFEINQLIAKKYKKIQQIGDKDKQKMILRYFGTYYICSLE